MKNIVKRFVGMMAVTATVLSFSSNAFADIKYESYDSLEVKNAGIGTLVNQKSEEINICGKNIDLTDVDSISVDNSVIYNIIDSKTKSTNLFGKDINYKNIDLTQINSSYIETYLKQKTDVKNMVER